MRTLNDKKGCKGTQFLKDILIQVDKKHKKNPMFFKYHSSRTTIF